MTTLTTQELFDILWLDHTSPENTISWFQGDGPFLKQVQNEFWAKVLSSITHIPKPDKYKLH